MNSSDPPSSRDYIAQARALILIAEDEPEIFEILAAYLQRGGMRVVHAGDGRAALKLHSTLKPDLVLLDVNMPQVDGWKVLSEIRSRGETPVIMLTAMDQEIDKLTGLRIGADDYVVKPFNAAVVVERVKAVLRRTLGGLAGEEPKVIRLKALEIDLEDVTVWAGIEPKQRLLNLTLTEFKLLETLARAPSRVFNRFELIERCLPEGDALERTVDSHLSKLRRKLEDAGVEDVPVTVRGIGYRFTTCL